MTSSFIPYQVDYSVKNTAKTLGFSKKRVSFKFGLANTESISQGNTGAGCRGSEHEVVFIWSLKTGKRQLFLDGKDIHFSESGQNGWTQDRAFQHVFAMKDVHDGGGGGRKFRIHFISQPVNREIPDSRPFEIKLNGISYFSFNQIFQLGTAAMLVRDATSPTSSRGGGGGYGGSGGGSNPSFVYEGRGSRLGRDSPLSPEERDQIAAAKLASLKEFEENARKEREEQEQQSRGRAHTTGSGPMATTATGSAMARIEESLISFDDFMTPPAPVTSPGGMMAGGTPPLPQRTGYNHFVSSITLDSTLEEKTHPPLPPSSTPVSSAASAPPSYGQMAFQYGTPQQQQQQAPPLFGQQEQYQQQQAPPLFGQQQQQQQPPPLFGQQQQQQPPPLSQSTALVPTNQPSNPYGLAPNSFQQQQQSPPPSMAYGYGNAQQQQQQQTQPPQLTSPSGQSVSSFNSYGSAPSFAHPPKPPPPQQQQQPSFQFYGQQPPPSSYGGGYAQQQPY